MRKIITTLLLGILTLGCMAQEDEPSWPSLPYSYTHDELCKPHKVTGGAGIVQFMKALDLYYFDEGYKPEPDDWNIVDKANGYYRWSEEGGGYLGIEAAYWNRSDGKKMLIVSYHVGGFGYGNHAAKLQKENEWFKLKAEDPTKKEFLYDEIGCMAFLYNATTQTLEPMLKPPFNGVPKTDDFILIYPPRKGKDIKVSFWNRETYGEGSEHTLKFNGLTFDWVK